MNQRLPAWHSLIALILLALLASCGIPLVPNGKLAENAQLYGKMELITEITLTGISPYIPDNTKGPELDQTPVLIPAPDNPKQLGWILFPAARTASGQSIVSINRQDLGQGGSLFGYYVDPNKQKHNIDAAGQFNSVSRLVINIPGPGANFPRLNAFPLNETMAYPSRLGILTQGNTTSNYYSTQFLIADKFSNNFTDLNMAYATGTYYPNQTFPGFGLSNDIIVLLFSNSNPPMNATTNAPWGTGINKLIMGIPSPDRSKVYFIGSSVPTAFSYLLSAYDFIPNNPISVPPEFSFNTPIANGNNLYPINHDRHSYFALDSVNNQYHISTFIPDGSQTYQISSIVSGANRQYISKYPIVRYLQDNTVLALVNNSWRKVNSFDSVTGVPTSLSPPIPTGSMIFDYDYTDGNGVKWMVFAETFVQPVAPGLFDDQKNKDNLVLRAWRIKQSDLIP